MAPLKVLERHLRVRLRLCNHLLHEQGLQQRLGLGERTDEPALAAPRLEPPTLNPFAERPAVDADRRRGNLRTARSGDSARNDAGLPGA